MTLRLSTRVRNGMLGTTGFRSLFASGCIEIRSGEQPASADAAATGDLLAIVTLDGGDFTPGSPTNGLLFDAPTDGIVQKAAGQSWEYTGLITGVAGWFRLKGNPADAGASDDDFEFARMDGSIGTSGDMLMTPAIVLGESESISDFRYRLPPE